jgi:hypothetical protein
VVYAGSGDTVTVTGLAPRSAYYVAVYDFNAFAPSQTINYRQLRPATGAQATTAFDACPAVKLYGENSAEVQLLRKYRDEVLGKTVAGRLAAKLYYHLAPWVDRLLEYPLVRQKARTIITSLLPLID